MKRILLIVVLTGISTFGFTQGAVDALRYSTISHNGDARFMSMGGAFGALGGNISSLNYNPAGIGIYRKSDFSITTSFSNFENTSIYNGQSEKESLNRFQISNTGLVLTDDYLNVATGSGWQSWQFGISYNMLKNFNNLVFISGPNSGNTIGDMYASLANGYSVDDIENLSENAFDLTPAWYSYLFNESGTAGQYNSASPDTQMQQSKLIDTWGSLSEIALSFGGNYSDKLFVGATIGIPIINYHEVSTYTETTDADITLANYRTAQVKDYLDTKAHGINLKLGMIYKANNMLRLGLAFHTPTYYYDINDTWKTKISSEYDDALYINSSPNGYYEYKLTTPMKAIASVALIFNKFGLLSLDYEYVDYSKAKLNADDYDFDAENDDIDQFLRSTSNLRIGTEWKFMNYSFRGGFAYYGSPYENNDTFGEKSIYSLGAGYREGNIYFDLAWTYTKTDEQDVFYSYGNIFTNPADIKSEFTNLIFTFGIRF